MNSERLVQMANQIARFFESQPGREQAVAGIADHLRRFWDPRMRDGIATYVAAGGQGLSEAAKLAVERLGAERNRSIGAGSSTAALPTAAGRP
jgi:formate dehydrogenase subunit delta